MRHFNVRIKKLVKEVCVALYKEYGLIPDRIAPSVEEGIFIYYKNINNNDLIIEVYKDFEIALLFTDNSGKGNFYSKSIKKG